MIIYYYILGAECGGPGRQITWVLLARALQPLELPHGHLHASEDSLQRWRGRDPLQASAPLPKLQHLVFMPAQWDSVQLKIDNI